MEKTQKRAVIEIGTNSIKFCIEGELDIIETARLGEDLGRTGEIGEKALERNARVVEKFARIAREAGADKIMVVGTMALRNAPDADAFCARVRSLCGLDVRVLSGEEEARLAFKAALSVAKDESNCTVFDTGGGSTEIVYGRGGDIIDSVSVNAGALNAGERLEPLIEKFKTAGVSAREGILIGVGGTATTLASVQHALVEYRPEAVHGSVLTANDVDAQISLYSSMPVEERKKIAGLSATRADIILSGATVVRALMICLDQTQFTVSTAGVRHALLAELNKEEFE